MREGTAPLIRREGLRGAAVLDQEGRPHLRPRSGQDARHQPDADRAQRRPSRPGRCRLHGEDIVLTRCLANGESVSFRHEGGVLVIDNVPEGSFTLEIRNTCAAREEHPALGLYTSGGGFFTQVRGRGLSPHHLLPRPAGRDGRVRGADPGEQGRLPGAALQRQPGRGGELDNGRHFARWHDPFPSRATCSPLVAARLVAREQRVRSRSDKDHLLQVWVREGDLDKTERAMESLVASVVWDEARFGLRWTSSAS
jgi:aminopeptidase N